MCMYMCITTRVKKEGREMVIMSSTICKPDSGQLSKKSWKPTTSIIELVLEMWAVAYITRQHPIHLWVV